MVLRVNTSIRLLMRNKLFDIPGMHTFCLPVLQNFFYAIFILILLSAPAVFASEKEETAPSTSLATSTFQKEGTVRLSEHLSLGVKVKRLLNSHTSYEFGNPYPPYQAPLSKLEFPLDSWWGGAVMRLNFPRFSMGVEVLTNALGDAGGRFRDSDWEDDSNIDMKTTYSVSRCRMEPSYMTRGDMDMEVSDWLGLPSWFSLRPVVGLRYQYFRMVAHNGIQYDLWTGTPNINMPQNGIRFKQTYWQYFMGVRLGTDLGQYVGVPDLKFNAQFNWAYVEGSNEDTHLLRNDGKRFTYEDTYGDAWYASIGLKKGLTKNLALSAEMDYLRINTTGSHRWLIRSEGFDQSCGNGVKVWSDQIGLSLTLQYSF